MFEIILLILVSAYFILLVFISTGLSRKISKQNLSKPFISVIIAARDEENNITACIDSLLNQSYDKDNYEVIIADDFSSDRTGDIIDKYIIDKLNFRKITPDINNSLTGKMNALDSALKCASGEIILFTDADCTVPENWIKNKVSYYKNNTAMVNGFTITSSDNLPGSVESIDLIFLISVAAGMANNGFPVSCIGNNMSVSKKVYDETGGYSSFKKNVAEDYLLLNAVRSLNKYKIIFPVDPDGLVKTEAHKNIKDIFRQKKRWASGGLSVPNMSFFLMAISFITNSMILISPFFLSSAVIVIISSKIFSDLFFLKQVFDKLKLKLNLLHFILFEIYYVVYTIILPVILLFNRKIIWKGRNY